MCPPTVRLRSHHTTCICSAFSTFQKAAAGEGHLERRECASREARAKTDAALDDFLKQAGVTDPEARRRTIKDFRKLN